MPTDTYAIGMTTPLGTNALRQTFLDGFATAAFDENS